MKKTATAALLLVLVLALAGCGSNTTTTVTVPAPPPATTTAPTAASVTVQLGEQQGSGLSGTATLTAVGSQTRVVVQLSGGDAGGDRPAHIHKGSCAQLDPTPAYALQDVKDGMSSTTVAVPLQALQAAQFAVNLHSSAQDLSKYVACGDIPLAVTALPGAVPTAPTTPTTTTTGY